MLVQTAMEVASYWQAVPLGPTNLRPYTPSAWETVTSPVIGDEVVALSSLTTHDSGVGVGLGDGDGLGFGEGDGDGLVNGEALGLGDGDGLGTGVGDGMVTFCVDPRTFVLMV